MKRQRETPKATGTSARAGRWEMQRHVLIVAAQRAIRKKGSAVSMDDIAAEAKVAKPILYRHFGDRAGLARALGESILLRSSTEDKVEMLQRMSAFYPTVDTTEDLLRVFQNFLSHFSTFVEMDTDLYRFLQNEQALQRMMEDEEGRRLGSPATESLARSLAALLKQRGLDHGPAELWAHALVALGVGAIDWWAENKPFHRFDLERHVLDLAQHGIAGLLARGAPQTRATALPTRARAVQRKPRRTTQATRKG